MWSHCTDIHPQMVSSLSHTQTVEVRNNLWLVPSKYIPAFPSRELMSRLYNEGQGGQYLIFIYRDSSTMYQKKDAADSTECLLRHSCNFIKLLRGTTQLHGKTTFVTLRASAVKSVLLPQFTGDLDLELSTSTSGLPLSHIRECSPASV
jgi:hypothetical protein